jgi:hypothetical protein
MSDVRELTGEEIDAASGGLTIGPLTIEASDGLSPSPSADTGSGAAMAASVC